MYRKQEEGIFNSSSVMRAQSKEVRIVKWDALYLEDKINWLANWMDVSRDAGNQGQLGSAELGWTSR